MTVSPRAQYLCGRSVVDLAELRDHRGGLHGADANPADQASTAAHADFRQAVYYQGILDELRAEVEAELAYHHAVLTTQQADADAPGVTRSQRIIQVEEAELAKISNLIDALSCRFPASRLDGQTPSCSGDSPRQRAAT